MDCMQWWGPGFHGFWIMPFVFMILMALLVGFLLFRRGAHGHAWGPSSWWSAGQGPWAQRWGGETPRQLLDRRYASGEITKQQYDEMRRDIESDPNPA